MRPFQGKVVRWCRILSINSKLFDVTFFSIKNMCLTYWRIDLSDLKS